MKRIDFDKAFIEANGKKYKIHKELTIARYKVMEQLEVEFYYGFTMKDMFDRLKAAYKDLNTNKLADSAVKVYQVMEGIADRIDEREPVMLRLASLFLCVDGEDLSKWDDDLAKEKIADWEAEGYAINDFFTLVANLVPGFIKHYQETLEGTLMEEEDEVGDLKSQSESKKQK